MTRSGFATMAVLLASLPSAVAQPINRADLKSGLIFTAKDAPPSTFSLTRLDPSVALTLAAGEAPHPRSTGGESFSWSGYINITLPGKYKFDAVLLGKLRVTIAGKEVFSGESAGKNPADAKLIAGPEVDLAGGIQPFEATLTRTGDAVRTELIWKGPNFFKPEPVPYFFFGHLPKQRPAEYTADLAREQGRFLAEELSCTKCHRPDANDKLAKTLIDRTGPNLSKIGERAYPGWLDAWLADPQKLRPNTVMPKMFADTDTGKAERYAVVTFLTSLCGPVKQPEAIKPDQLAKSVATGKRLFLTAGCAACHGDKLTEPPTKAKPKDEEEEKEALKPEDSFYAIGTATPTGYYRLGAVGSKFTPDSLKKFLDNPLATNPHGRMPNMVLQGQESTDIARFLCMTADPQIPQTLAEPPLKPAQIAGNIPGIDPLNFVELKPADQWKELGKRLVVSRGCVNCHAIDIDRKPLKADGKFPTLAEVQKSAPGTGCLAEAPTAGKTPAYPLDAKQKSAVASFLRDGLAGPGTSAPAYHARTALKRFNCLNCHNRDAEGGVDEALADTMKMLEKAENADDVQPPRLTGVGHKVRPSWAKAVLTQAGRARGWMTLRMPQYGEANVGFLPDALPKLEGTVPEDVPPKLATTPGKIADGRTLAGKNGLGCTTCHDISGVVSGGTRGPDLATISQRVRLDWYNRWMHQPQRLAPGTRMPQNFLDGKSQITTILGGDGDAQIEALWSYFALGPGLPLPAGLEPPKGVVVTVKDRPEIMRTFMPDQAGTKPIAVGYPGGLNLVFDTAQCRLGYAWSGNFLDLSTVWVNRGGNPAKLLGPKFWTAPPGNPWAMTESRTPPDFLKRANDPAYGHQLNEDALYSGPRHLQFSGYGVDDKGQPEFRYTLSDPDDKKVAIKVTEKPTPVAVTVAAGLKRSFSFEADGKKTPWFFLAVASKEPRITGRTGENPPFDLKQKFSETPATGLLIVPTGDNRATAFQVADVPAGTTWAFAAKPGGGWTVMLRFPETDKKTDFSLTTWGLPRDDDDLVKGLKLEGK